MTPDDPKRSKRPVVGSRNPTARPRKVAGSGVVPPGPEAEIDAPRTAESPPPETETPALSVVEDESAHDRAVEEEPKASEPGLLSRSRTTGALVVALLLVAGLLVAEGIYLWVRDEPTVSSQRPVVTGEMAHRSAVSAAAEAAKEIVSIKYQDYDAEVEAATAKMTDSFAAEYRTTAEEIRPEFVAAKKEVEVQVVVSGVVRASSSQVQALVFLNQYVTTEGKDTSVTPYRTLVTVNDTDSGWLVSDIETK